MSTKSTIGTVMSQNIPNRQLTVVLRSGQIVQVRMLETVLDGARCSHRPMPGLGTSGLVVFPIDGDSRNGIWLGAINAHFQNAYTTNTDPNVDYDAHPSGAYEYQDGTGGWIQRWPDGTYMMVSGSATKPTLYRHVVDNTQTQQLVPFTDAQRTPNPPAAPYTFTIVTSGGTSLTMAPTGDFLITNGHATVSGTAAGTLNITAAQTINITAATSINLGSSGETLHKLINDTALALYNGHTHASSSSPPDAGHQWVEANQATSIVQAG